MIHDFFIQTCSQNVYPLFFRLSNNRIGGAGAAALSIGLANARNLKILE